MNDETVTFAISCTDQSNPLIYSPFLSGNGSSISKGIHIYSENSKIILPEDEVTEVPEQIDDLGLLFFKSQGEVLALPQTNDSNEFQKVQVPIGKMAENLEAIIVKNKNTHRYFSIRNITITDPTARGDYEPANAISRAQDAIIIMDGI